MKQFILASLLATAFILPAQAQSIILGTNNKTVIQGQILDIGYESFTLVTNDGKEINIDLDLLDLDNGDFNDYFRPGEYVRVSGNLEDSTLEARQVIHLDNLNERKATLPGAIN